jgi:hypothetical protein
MISILIESISREIEAFLNCEGFSKIARFFKYIFSGIEAFLKRVRFLKKYEALFKIFYKKLRLFQQF